MCYTISCMQKLFTNTMIVKKYPKKWRCNIEKVAQFDAVYLPLQWH